MDHAVTPVQGKGDQRDLISRYGEQLVQQAQVTWACLLDATAEAGFEERVLSAVTVRDAWCQILNWTGPSSEAEILFLESQLETVPNYGDENPKPFFLEWTSYLPACDRSMPTKPSSRSFISSSATFPTTMRSRSAPGSTLLFSGAKTWSISSAPPGPLARRAGSNSDRHQGWRPIHTRLLLVEGSRSAVEGMEDRGEAVVDRAEVDTEYSSPGLAVEATIMSTASSHSSTPVHRQNRWRQILVSGPSDGGTNAGGWPQEESTPSPNGSVPHCERCRRKGHVATICREPLRFEGTCGTCGQYGHRMRYCIQNQPAPHAYVVLKCAQSPLKTGWFSFHGIPASDSPTRIVPLATAPAGDRWFDVPIMECGEWSCCRSAENGYEGSCRDWWSGD